MALEAAPPAAGTGQLRLLPRAPPRPHQRAQFRAQLCARVTITVTAKYLQKPKCMLLPVHAGSSPMRGHERRAKRDAGLSSLERVGGQGCLVHLSSRSQQLCMPQFPLWFNGGPSHLSRMFAKDLTPSLPGPGREAGGYMRPTYHPLSISMMMKIICIICCNEWSTVGAYTSINISTAPRTLKWRFGGRA